MTDQHTSVQGEHDRTSDSPAIDRRSVLSLGSGMGLTTLAGCSSLRTNGRDTETAATADDTDDQSTGTPASCGIAAEYPDDDGISEHPSVILHEDFEHADMDVLDERYSTIKNPDGIEFVDEVAPGSPGDRSVRMRSIGDEDTGAYLYRELLETYDRLHLRYYVRHVHGYSYHHTAGRLGGYNPSTAWPQGGAGVQPDGDDRITVRAESVDDDYGFDLYAYWMEMRSFPDEMHWGNTFLRGQRPTVPDGDWMAVELMVELNDPVDERNGELALWLDGEQIIHLRPGEPTGEWTWGHFTPDPDGEPFEGLRWRNDPDLGLSFVQLEHYVTGHDPGEESFVWFNDMVLATEYIGPIC